MVFDRANQRDAKMGGGGLVVHQVLWYECPIHRKPSKQTSVDLTGARQLTYLTKRIVCKPNQTGRQAS